MRAIRAAQRLPNLHLDTSSVVFMQYLEQAAQELPAEKLPPEKEALVLGGNIRRLLGLD